MRSSMGSRLQLFRLLYRMWRRQAMVDWFKKHFKAEEILSNGCVPSGHRFSSYGMCTICGGYR